MKETLRTDVYQVIEHRKTRKAKVSFSAVMNKVVVTGVILASLVTSTVPAFAATPSTSNINSSSTVTQNFEMSIENQVYNIVSVLDKLEGMIKDGTLNSTILQELATQLMTLDRAVSTSGKSATAEVISVVERAEKVVKEIKGVEGLATLEATILMIKNNLGIEITTTIENTKAAQIKNFPDVVEGQWYYATVTKLVSKGAISGFPDGTFGPGKPITNAEYIAILMRTTEGKTYGKASADAHWASGVMEAAYRAEVVKPSEIDASNYNKLITRAEMAVYTERAVEYILKESKPNSTGMEYLMKDYNQIKGSKYEYYIKNVYARGIISGDDKGNFNPNKNATRAEASAFILRTIEKENRRDMEKVEIPTAPVVEGQQTLNWDDPNRAMAKEGDIFITPDGREVVLKVDEQTGILGFGQNVATELGRSYTNGKIQEHGDLGRIGEPYTGSPYLVDKHTGMGLYRSQWDDVRRTTNPTKVVQNPKEGQTYGDYWLYEGGVWFWEGPTSR